MKNIQDSFNNSELKGNMAIQADNVKQSINYNETDKEKAFQELFNAIKTLENDSIRDQAQYNAEELKDALDKGDTKKGQKLLGFLQGALGAASSLATIAQFFGLPIPPLP
ncbi:hypothetical protein [Peribacillus simplex]|uniref:hypothetical protein n=1 Tax=Peribacillus simplex TaxID=1478 RepID=UPI0033362694